MPIPAQVSLTYRDLAEARDLLRIVRDALSEDEPIPEAIWPRLCGAYSRLDSILFDARSAQGRGCQREAQELIAQAGEKWAKGNAS